MEMDEDVEPPETPPQGPDESGEGGGEIIIVGTAHVSERSIEEVKGAIDEVQPDVVAVELCPRRYKSLVEQERQKVSVKDVLKGGQLYFFLVQWLLAYVQRKIGADMGVEPGAEMVSAVEKAHEMGAQVALVDRDISVTLQRFWAHMTFVEKFRMFWALLLGMFGLGDDEVDMDTITDEDVVSMLMRELREMVPNAAHVLVDERDQYLAGKLLQVAGGKRVLAVVGAGHRDGVIHYLEHPEEIPSFESLETVPRKRFSAGTAIGGIIMGMILAILVLLFLSGAPPMQILLALAYLFATQGVLSAAGVVAARGHPLSVATAFGLAWFGFLHPFLAVGWIAGLVEAALRPPAYDDFKSVMDADTLRGLLSNRFFKVIMVAALANLGSMIGTFVAIPLLIHYMGITNPIDIIQGAVAGWI